MNLDRARSRNAFADVTINVTDAEAGKPDAPTVTRTRFETETNPALDVSWTAPEANGTTIDGYKVQYRKQVADGETPNAWTAYTFTDANERVIVILPASTLSVTVPDLEPGATYEFQVRATTAKEGHGPWSDTGSGRANRPPHYAVHDGQVITIFNEMRSKYSGRRRPTSAQPNRTVLRGP